MRKAIEHDGFRNNGRVAAFDAKPRKRKVRFVKAGFWLDAGKANNKKKQKQKKKNKKRKKNKKAKKR